MTDYLLGLQRLEEWFAAERNALPNDEFAVLANLKMALVENLDDERKLAGLVGPVEKTERRRILDQLNRLTLKYCEIAFINLCNPSQEFSINRESTSRGEQIIIVLGDFIKSVNILSGQFEGPTAVDGGEATDQREAQGPIYKPENTVKQSLTRNKENINERNT